MREHSYVVRNPIGIDPGIVIISWRPPGHPEDARDWYEGDRFIPPNGMDTVDVEDWLENGFIEEAEWPRRQG